MPTLTETLQSIYERKSIDSVNDLDNAVHNYCDATMCEECKIGRADCVQIMDSIKTIKENLKRAFEYA